MRSGSAFLALGLLAVAILLRPAAPVAAYVDGGPMTLGGLCAMSSHIMVVRIENYSAEKRVIVYRKVADLKGQYPRDIVRHALGPTHGARPSHLQPDNIGKTALIFSYWYNGQHDGLGGPEAKGGLVRSYTYFDRKLYICYVGNWDGGRCDDPRTIVQKFCGSPERLRAAVVDILAGKEAVVPCIVPDAAGRPTIQRLKAGSRQMDYNPKRDFVGFGGDDFSRLEGMPGFSSQSQLPNLGAGAQGISVMDLDGNGGTHLCLFGAERLEVLRNLGDSLLEMPLPGLGDGCRAALWADYSGDGKPDLLLATPAGPRLHTNLGNGTFRDDTALLPREPGNATAAAWLDYDGDGRPDILLMTGFHGLRLYRNLGQADPVAKRWFEDISTPVGLGPAGIGGTARADTLAVADVNGDGRADVLCGAGTGLLLLNTPQGFVEKKDSGIAYQPGQIGPVFGDFDNSGALSLFLPQRDGSCKLFQNDGQGRFRDVTARAGDLARPQGLATCAAWGDLDSDGHLDLVIGCLRGPNRYLRNRGDGTFEDASARIGLDRRIFNTQAIALLDLNADGVLDMVFANEGQHSLALMGDATLPRPRTPVALTLPGGGIGSRLRLIDATGKAIRVWENSGGGGRGGQPGSQALWALAPGRHRIEVRASSGLTRSHDITVADTPLRAALGTQ